MRNSSERRRWSRTQPETTSRVARSPSAGASGRRRAFGFKGSAALCSRLTTRTRFTSAMIFFDLRPVTREKRRGGITAGAELIRFDVSFILAANLAERLFF